jgi:hypothetical protein
MFFRVKVDSRHPHHPTLIPMKTLPGTLREPCQLQPRRFCPTPEAVCLSSQGKAFTAAASRCLSCGTVVSNHLLVLKPDWPQDETAAKQGHVLQQGPGV